mmetsp:Transcript_75926/g.214853  ORF Transcript_75926/g.214853 Transcript_75926/m.214853 type:complete len:254 (-) Transcript_75926:350-1111(-)
MTERCPVQESRTSDSKSRKTTSSGDNRCLPNSVHDEGHARDATRDHASFDSTSLQCACILTSSSARCLSCRSRGPEVWHRLSSLLLHFCSSLLRSTSFWFNVSISLMRSSNLVFRIMSSQFCAFSCLLVKSPAAAAPRRSAASFNPNITMGPLTRMVITTSGSCMTGAQPIKRRISAAQVCRSLTDRAFGHILPVPLSRAPLRCSTRNLTPDGGKGPLCPACICRARQASSARLKQSAGRSPKRAVNVLSFAR